MKRIPFYSPLCMLCAALVVLAACGKESDNTLPNSPLGAEALRVQATQLGFVEEDGKTRATTDDATMRTTFQPGDAIGIFAVKGGVVQTDCKNLKLTMQSDRSWGGNTVFFTEGTTYFAYSPYRDVAGINSAVSIDNIVANFTLSNNQSSAALYAANDLMTSTTCTANKTAKTLTIAFEHRFALVEMDYVYCKGRGTGAGKFYPLNSLDPCELHLVDESSAVVNGYRYASPYKIRFLLKPGTARKVAAIYKYGDNVPISDKYITYYQDGVTFNLAGGRRYKLKPYKNRNVKVYDYYYYDGSIYPKEWVDAGGTPPNVSSGCRGIVFATSNSNEGFANTNKLNQSGIGNWTNGYVLSVQPVDATKSWYTYLAVTFKPAYDLSSFQPSQFNRVIGSTPAYGYIQDSHQTYGLAYMEIANGDNPYETFTTVVSGGTEITSVRYPLYCLIEQSHAAIPNASVWFPPTIKQASIAARNLAEISGGLFNTSQNNSWYTENKTDIDNFRVAFSNKLRKVNPSIYPSNIAGLRIYSCSYLGMQEQGYQSVLAMDAYCGVYTMNTAQFANHQLICGVLAF